MPRISRCMKAAGLMAATWGVNGITTRWVSSSCSPSQVFSSSVVRLAGQ